MIWKLVKFICIAMILLALSLIIINIVLTPVPTWAIRTSGALMTVSLFAYYGNKDKCDAPLKKKEKK